MSDYGGIVTTPPTNNTASGNEQLVTKYGPELLARINTALQNGDTPFNVTTGGDYTPNNSVIFVGDTTTSTIGAQAETTATIGSNSTTDFTGSSADVGVLIDGSGNTVTVGAGNNLVQAQVGGNTLTDTREAGGGQTTLSSGFGAVSMVSGSGHTVMYGGSEAGDTMRGGAFQGAHDTIFAGIGGDLIVTKAGHNLIYGNENDTIKAGNAKDTIVAGYSAETVTGGHSSVVFGGGETLMKGGNQDKYYMTGSDTMLGSSHSNKVFTTEGSTVLVEGGKGHIDVNLASSSSSNDTIFGGTGGLTIHVQENFVETGIDTMPGAGFDSHILQSASGQTLHVSGVTIDFNGDTHKV